jgi:hypothetical protein
MEEQETDFAQVELLPCLGVATLPDFAEGWTLPF